MSQCSAAQRLRPIHPEYLRNMGVTATLTISLIIGGKLCGHDSPATMANRGSVLFRFGRTPIPCGKVTAAQIGARATATQAYRSKRTEMLAKFLEQISAVGDFASGLTQGQPNLLSFIGPLVPSSFSTRSA